MVKKILPLLLIICYLNSYADTIKTDVLVVGGTPSGVSAAIQGSRSKLKTLLIESSGRLGGKLTESHENVVRTNANLPSGIWGEFRLRVRDFYKKTPGYDSTLNAPLKFDGATGAGILKKMTDTVKNLTVKLNTSWTAIKKEGTAWEVTITIDGKTDLIKAKVVVDATPDCAVATKAVGVDKLQREITMVADDIDKPYDRQSKLYRTSIGVADGAGIRPFSIPLGAVVMKNADNLLVTGGKFSNDASINDAIADPAVQFTLGQGVGASAAFCAFFKTTTKSLRVRTVQGELLDFKGYLLPFSDVNWSDRYFRAYQQIAATGMLKGIKLGTYRSEEMFMPDTVVNTAEIKPVLSEVYTRAFIWLNREKPSGLFTVGNLVSLLSEFTLTDPKVMQMTLQKNWSAQYHFSSVFDTKKPVTRREFAVLVNKYLNPFARTVDITGKLIN